ncbi:hypothetical protein A5653_17660 [Mycobacterium colombiense]|nr:hypothetical protein A5653_17660 [Mycobacterium colombiense]
MRISKALPEHKLRDLYEQQGLSFNEIARQLDLDASQTYACHLVSKLAQQYRIPCRHQSRPKVDFDWLYEQHILRRRTFVDLSREIGVNEATIFYWARKYGIENQHHQWDAPDLRTVRLLQELSIDPTLCSPLLTNARTWARVQRFLVVARYDTLTSAARDLGCSAPSLGYLVRLLQRDFGQKLIEPANGPKRTPMKMTDFGEKLVLTAYGILEAIAR